MNLQQEWHQLNAELNQQYQDQSWEIQLDEKSHNLMQSLLFKLKWKLRWIRIIDIPILIAAFLTEGDLRLVLIGIFLVYEIAGFAVRFQFRKIKTAVDYGSNTKKVINDNYLAIRKILGGETLWAYIFIPVAGPIGHIVFRLTKTNDLIQIFQSQKILMHLFVSVLVSIPFIFIGKRMNDSIFKKPLEELNEKLMDLEKIQ